MLSKTSRAVEDYVKALYLEAERLSSEAPATSVSTTAVAERLGVSAASATNMLKKLAELGFASYVPYRGAKLTDEGRALALEIVRHHRLLETYLSQALGVPWDQIHDEAEVLEHVLSEALEERIAEHLGHPIADPHGHPIPTRDGRVQESDAIALWQTEDGASVEVLSVSDEHPDALRYLYEIGIRPGTKLKIVGRGPVGGPLFVRVGPNEKAISQEVAGAIWVR